MPDQIAEKIRAMIRGGQLKPGSRLPSHAELCREWGASLTTIRDTLTKLESIGILTKIQGRGTYVREVSVGHLVTREELTILLSKSDVFQLLEARHIIEVALAELAAHRRTAEQIKRMGIFIAQMDRAHERSDLEAYAQADNDFHLLLCEMSRNAFFNTMMHSIGPSLFTQHMQTIALKRVDQIRMARETQVFHREIYEAIKAKDADLARARMSEHLKSVRKYLKK